jgi:fructokinase
MVYFGTLAQRSAKNRRALKRLLEIRPRHVFFDVNLRQKFWNKNMLIEGFKASTIVKFNDDEWRVIRKLAGVNSPGGLIREYGPEMVIVTKGGKGADVYTAGAKLSERSPNVKVVDAVGAGDAFSGTMAAAVLRGVPLKKALKQACAVGAYVVTRHGAQDRLPAKMRTFN